MMKLFLLLGVVIAASASATLWLVFRPKAETAQPDVLVVMNGQDLDFGTVWLSPDFKRTIKFKNVSDKEVTISRFMTSCTCVQYDPQTLTLTPGADGEITLTLDLGAAFSKPHKDPFAAAFQSTIVATSDGQSLTTAPWTIRGYVRRPIILQGSSLDLTEGYRQGAPFPPRTIRARINPLLDPRKVELKCDSAYSIVDLVGQDLETNEMVAKLHLKSTLSPGPFSFDLGLTFLERDSENQVLCSLPIKGTIGDPIYLSPSTLVFGPQQLGREVTASTTIHSTGEKFVVEKTERSESDVSIVGTDAPDVFMIHVKYVQPGQQTRTVSFYVRREGVSPGIFKLEQSIKYYAHSP